MKREHVRAHLMPTTFLPDGMPDALADARVLKRKRNRRTGDVVHSPGALDVFRARFQSMGADEESISIRTDLPNSTELLSPSLAVHRTSRPHMTKLALKTDGGLRLLALGIAVAGL